MAAAPHPGFRIYILGAGFSRPAGLPLATELFPAVRARIEHQHGVDTKFHRDLQNCLSYCEDCGIEGQNETSLDLELFMSYLDIEHYLELRGSDTWSQEGNETQLIIRKAIGAVIHERTPPPDKLPDVYYRFAERLSAHDTTLTFDYDLVLEGSTGTGTRIAAPCAPGTAPRTSPHYVASPSASPGRSPAIPSPRPSSAWPATSASSSTTCA